MKPGRNNLLFVLLFIALSGFAQSGNIETISLQCSDEPLGSVLQKLRARTNIDFIYDAGAVDAFKVTCLLVKCSLEAGLVKILTPCGLTFKKFNKSFVLYRSSNQIRSHFKTEIITQTESDDSGPAVIIEPKILTKKDIIYPAEAVKKNIQGEVTVKFLLSTEGRVKMSILEQASGFGILDSAALRYVESLEYSPALSMGQPHIRWTALKFRFCISK